MRRAFSNSQILIGRKRLPWRCFAVNHKKNGNFSDCRLMQEERKCCQDRRNKNVDKHHTESYRNYIKVLKQI